MEKLHSQMELLCVLTSLGKSPRLLQPWPDSVFNPIRTALACRGLRNAVSQTVAGLASFTHVTGRTLPLISSQVISLEDNYFYLKMALNLEPKLGSGTVQLGGERILKVSNLLTSLLFQSMLRRRFLGRGTEPRGGKKTSFLCLL